MNAILLARIQFALTVGFHFIFPPISIGLAWLLVVAEGLGWRRNDAVWREVGRFFGGLLAITFAVGVASGIVMEFQFGTNWAGYSRFVGDIFGAPLAAEALFAFFLESTFLGLYLFGRDRVSKGVHWFSILMVAVGSTLSAFWILVANSWQQTPAGFELRNGRAELTSFFEAVFNPSTLPRFLHTIDASLIAGAFFMAGIAAALLFKDGENAVARKALKLALVFGLVFGGIEVFPSGHYSAQQVAATQPAKLAACEGLFEGQERAPLTVFGVPGQTELKLAIGLPGALSLLAFNRFDAYVAGLHDFPEDERPPVFITFTSFHLMVGLGTLFLLMLSWGCFRLWQGRLWTDRLTLGAFVLALPLPVVACELGWMCAEVGRQPWIVYKLLRTADAASEVVSAGAILFSILLFGAIYLLLGALYVYLIVKMVRRGPGPTSTEGSAA
ncbi:MAG TPA: cytochrome ubiquinol oxidase subunit I [Candidatus Hydrogenedentes bacterium]|nr:cytochrome ubiquinol oxidase subunit I [Candidatus Hydrogenedentota bacterium]HPG70106.1 cytochrome ubiquinol oxidase subunit I [Candidatus Hydrogenedentota bacterium]